MLYWFFVQLAIFVISEIIFGFNEGEAATTQSSFVEIRIFEL